MKRVEPGPLLLGATIVLSLFTCWNAGKTPAADSSLFPLRLTGRTDSLIITNVYRYRNIGVAYDSVTAQCMYGELFIPNYGGSGDSLQIDWQQYFMLPGIDTSAGYINQISRSRTFALTSSTELTMFRVVFMTFLDTTGDYSLPDTTAWVMELWNAQSGARIARIDSVGICRAIDYDRQTFPPLFGLLGDKGYEIVSIMLGSYAIHADSAYLTIRIRNFNQANDPHCGINDDRTYNRKYSEASGLFAKRKIPPVPSPATVDISVFPNPATNSSMLRVRLDREQEIDLSIFDAEGRRVGEVFHGRRNAGTSLMPLNIDALRPGAHFLRAALPGENRIITEKFAIVR